MIAIDSYGWIERFTSGPKAELYNELIDKFEPSRILTSALILYEVYKKVKVLLGEQKALEAVAVLSQTNVVDLDQTLALEAADFSLEHKLHMADAIIYATARHYQAELYTSDENLRGLPGVNYV